MPIKKATKQKQKATMLFYGASGTGKTWNALQIASLLTSGKIVVIDTENGTSSLYSDIYDFDILEMDAPYSQEAFQKAFKEAESHVGENGVIIVDTLSKFWDGVGGATDEANKLSGGSQAKTRDAWAAVTPKVLRTRELLTSSKTAHIIATCRVKSETIMEEYTNYKGEKKTKSVKVGMAPIFKDGIEYDFQTAMEFFVEINTEGRDVQRVRSTKKNRFPYLRVYEGVLGDTVDGYRTWDAEEVVNNLKFWLEQGEDPAVAKIKNRILVLQDDYKKLAGAEHSSVSLTLEEMDVDSLTQLGKALRAEVDAHKVPM